MSAILAPTRSRHRPDRAPPLTVGPVLAAVAACLVSVGTLAVAAFFWFGAAAAAYEPGPQFTILPAPTVWALRGMLVYALLLPGLSMLACALRRAWAARLAALLFLAPLASLIGDAGGMDLASWGIVFGLLVAPAGALVLAARAWDAPRPR